MTDAERSRKRGTEGALDGMDGFSIDTGVQWVSGEADGKTTSKSDIGSSSGDKGSRKPDERTGEGTVVPLAKARTEIGFVTGGRETND